MPKLSEKKGGRGKIGINHPLRKNLLDKLVSLWAN